MTWIAVVTKPDPSQPGKGRETVINSLNIFAVTKDDEGDAIVIAITGHRIPLDMPFIEVVAALAEDGDDD